MLRLSEATSIGTSVPHGRGNSHFQEYFYKAFEQLYPDKKVRKHMCSIRAGNLKFLESHNVKYFEIKFRQRMNTHDPVHFYMEDQSASVNVINKYLK